MTRRSTFGLSTFFVGIGLLGAGVFWSSPSRAAPQGSPTAAPTPPVSSTHAVAILRQKRMVDSARNAFDDALARYAAGNATLEEVATWSRRTYADDPDRTSSTATTAFIDRAERIEKEVKKRVGSGNAPKADSLAAAYFRAEADAAEANAALLDKSANPLLTDPNGYR